jgi:hypothetical protein
VITERVLLTEGTLEDGSVTGSVTELGSDDGAPDRVGPLMARIERAFGLESAAGALRFLERVGDFGGHHLAAFEGVPPPAYASPDMELSVRIDRGDVWYELPFDDEGRPIRQPIERGPTLTLFVEHEGRTLPLVRYRTTIGGWRILDEGGREVWRYMESPVGARVWSEIVAAPVWLPPSAYPDESLVTSLREGVDGKPLRELDSNLVGPSYASAYGLVAAYHRRFARSAKGALVVLGDEGIRTHGSSDYTSPWHEVSLGCHRLRNHLALRLFTYLLRHRPHQRVGYRPVSYVRTITVPGFEATLRIARSGYVFALDRPVVVDVTPGRVLGPRRRPYTGAIPVTHPVDPHQDGPMPAPAE